MNQNKEVSSLEILQVYKSVKGELRNTLLLDIVIQAYNYQYEREQRVLASKMPSRQPILSVIYGGKEI